MQKPAFNNKEIKHSDIYHILLHKLRNNAYNGRKNY